MDKEDKSAVWRSQKVEELLSLRDEAMITNEEWAELTRGIDPVREEGVHYQTIRRMQAGERLPRVGTLRVLEKAVRKALREREEAMN